jgi:hypothetical protein
MNKNLSTYSLNWHKVEVESDYTREELMEWADYQFTELRRLVQHHIERRVKTRPFVSHFNAQTNLFKFTLVNSLEKFGGDTVSMVRTFKDMIEVMAQDVSTLNRMPNTD